MSPRPAAVLDRFVSIYIPVVITLVLLLFPFYWMAITSIKPNAELFDVKGNPFIVLQPTLDHYKYLFERTLFANWILNTTFVACLSTAISLALSVPAGYALARFRFPGGTLLGWAIFVTYLVPQTLLFLPLAQVVNWLGLANTLWSLVLTYPTFLVPFGSWLLIGYFRSIPKDLEESALVDGATRLQALIKIALPLAIPGILSVGIFSFTLSWNEFIYALVFISDPTNKTVPVGVTSELIRGDVFFWGSLMAGALLGSVPVALIYSFFVEYFVAGLTAGAVKG
ncbi:MAG: sugar ABC transporter permease [Chloroflexota bacterium]